MLKLKIFVLFLIATIYSAPAFGVITLQTEYQDSFPKFYFINKDKKEITGLCKEIIEAVQKNLINIQINAENSLVPLKRIQKNLDFGKTKVFFGFAKNKTRLGKFIFIDPPLYEVNHIVAVKSDDTVNVTSLDDIKSLRGPNIILTNYGTATERFLKKNVGLIIDSGGKKTKNNLYKLIQGKGRFVYFHDIGLVSTIKREKLQNKVKVLPTSFRKYYHYAAFSKTVDTVVVKKIQVALHKLKNSGELNRIRIKYSQF